jgi:hypothetical protein
MVIGNQINVLERIPPEHSQNRADSLFMERSKPFSWSVVLALKRFSRVRREGNF